MSITSYSNTDPFEQSMNNIANNKKIDIIDNSPIFANPKGMFENFNDLWGNTIGDEIVHNEELINKDYEPALDQMMGEPQSFDVPVPKGIKNTTKEIMNQREDGKMKKTYQKKKKKAVSTSKYLKNSDIIKVKWTESEDIKLKELMALGLQKWTTIAKKFEGRTGKQCRERWHNHAGPDIKKTKWSEEEEQILIEEHKVVGTQWIKIAQKLPGRSYNNVKNHWNSTKRKVQNQSGGTVKPVGNNILENYIRYVTINNDDFLKTAESDGETTNSENDDDSIDMLYGEMNLSLEATAETTKPLTDASTILPYIPMPEENSTVEVCKTMEDILELLSWWE
ncbi:transcription factor MYB115 isoform X1 [Arabidopsis lyrata subsp. lyrata]|nr:transcription factor MYB115 isoform X1 [Arabidopsis lyrata subsp. lyrata]|eukprot:XP_002868650.2 transcription factor MYB115 isoform X1 [Arabidopsis lyrata subsp. lyrata]